MDLDEALRALRIEDAKAAIEPMWAESALSFPSGGVRFLQPAFVAEACEYAGLSAEITAGAIAAAARIASDPAAAVLAWHAHCVNAPGNPGVGKWPELDAALDVHAGFFYLLVLLSEYPAVRRIHERHGIPRDVVQDTLRDVAGRAARRRGDTCPFRVPVEYAGGWLRHHFRGELYTLGRLQYMQRTAPDAFVFFRRRSDGAVLALAAGGQEFRADGQFNGAAGIKDETGVWISTWTEAEGVIRAHPIDPASGAALPKPVAIRRAEWDPALSPGDAILDVHIPPSGPLTPEACAESVRRASEFYVRHFPETPPPRGVMTKTWLCDAQLERYLPPDSNIVRFLREYYLCPAGGDQWSAIRFVFGLNIEYGYEGPIDFSALPRQTQLQQALLRHIEEGGRWRKGCGFYLFADLPWGRQVYRRHTAGRAGNPVVSPV